MYVTFHHAKLPGRITWDLTENSYKSIAQLKHKVKKMLTL